MELIFLYLSVLLTLISAFQVHVDKSAGSGGDGSEQSPFQTIQEGLDVAGTELIIYDGTYTGEGNVNLSLSSSYTTIRSINGPLSSIIDCENTGSALGIELFSGTFTIQGLGIKNCNSQQRLWDYNGVNFTGSWGGGIWIRDTFTQIIDCIIEGNVGDRGGAVGIFSNTVFMANSTIRDNRARDEGGAIYIESAYLKLENVTIEDNNADGLGGGVFLRSGTIEMFDGSMISDNTAGEDGDNAACASAAIVLQTNDTYIEDGIYCASCDVVRTNPQENLCPPDLETTFVTTANADILAPFSYYIITFICYIFIN